MLVSENHVIMHNAKFFGSPINDTFIETRVDYSAISSIPDDDGSKTAFIGVYLQMDDQYKISTRKVVTFQKAFSDSGGFMSIIFLASMILVRNVQTSVYYTSLTQGFYKYEVDSSSDPASPDGGTSNKSKSRDELREDSDHDPMVIKIAKQIEKRKPLQYSVWEDLEYSIKSRFP